MARNWPNLVLSGTLFALSIAYLLHAFVGELAPINEIVLLIPKIRRHIELLSENAGTSMANLAKDLYLGVFISSSLFGVLTPFAALATKNYLDNNLDQKLEQRFSNFENDAPKVLLGAAVMVLWFSTMFLTSIPNASDHHRIFRLPANVLVVMLDSMCTYFLILMTYAFF